MNCNKTQGKIFFTDLDKQKFSALNYNYVTYNV